MVTAAQPKTRKSLDEMYEIDNKIYKRFDSSKEGFVTLGSDVNNRHQTFHAATNPA